MAENASGHRAGRVALVTGGGGGIGQGIVLELTAAGYVVAVNDVRPDAATRTTVLVDQAGGHALAVPGDVSRRYEVQRMIDETLAHFGALDLVVNNAGIQVWKPLLELEDQDWDSVLNVNLRGCFLCTQIAARVMQGRGGGHIVNIGSGSNLTPFPQLVSYTASKGGIEMLTKVAAVELGPLGIRVNCLAPGAIEIERTRLERKDYAGTWARVTPLRRIGTPEDIGRAVVVIDDPRSAFITGQTILVDGGLFTAPPWPPDSD
jgi:3-oxoacyl-[acyl-carrier protein] reductase